MAVALARVVVKRRDMNGRFGVVEKDCRTAPCTDKGAVVSFDGILRVRSGG